MKQDGDDPVDMEDVDVTPFKLISRDRVLEVR